jgi:dihydrofolate synthase/folylpolyglutamate synthase
MSGSLDDWLATLERRHFKAIDMGLERCGRVYRALGSPSPAARVFCVAGTNGKGSVAAYLSSFARAAGLRCGTYTSPHILRFNERIRIAGEAATDTGIVHAFEAVEAARNGISLTYFEFTTLAAFHHLSEQALDLAVLEVGLGGRLDAVNLVDGDCAVITPIGLDHQDYLGGDRERIGREKAGIVRAGKPVVCGDRDPPASVIAHALSVAAPLFRLGVDFGVEARRDGVVYSMAERRLELPRPPLPGRHQVDNLATALAAFGSVFPDLLREPQLLARGICETRIGGRLQAHPEDPRVLLDVGHNPMAAAAVAAYLAQRRHGRCACVIGMLADKDVEGVAEALAARIDAWYCGGLGGARGQDGNSLARRIGERAGDRPVKAFGGIGEALDRARSDAAPDATVLVFGSFETVASALRHMAGGSVHGAAMLIES